MDIINIFITFDILFIIFIIIVMSKLCYISYLEDSEKKPLLNIRIQN